MQFNSDTNGLDLYTDARYLCGLDETSDTTSYPIKAFTRNANVALDKYNVLALKADSRWKFDDFNNTDLPIATADLVANQQDYALAVSHLKITRVRIKDAQGNWLVIPQVNPKHLNDSQLQMAAGMPEVYYPQANSIFFVSSPNYSYTAGLELTFQRGANYFTYTDSTKSPGFAIQFHRLISLEGALEYCELNGLADRAGALRLRIGTPPDLMNGQPGSGMAKEFVDFYSQRNGDNQPTLQLKRDDYGQIGMESGPTSSLPGGFTS